ncbi:MAG: hypothetical protein DRJ35_02290 [Thermoprotei archaeon]|nr:MAG: hypothetical protein DRJ35_02290 [Thermoprotei archaeon]
MHVLLEYLAIGVLIILFITISLNIITDVTGRLGTVKEEQLFNVAERLMDKILLTPGYPPNWGTDFTQLLSDFGLALNGTRTPYVVDPDKVMRLSNLSVIPNPLLINSSRIAVLLGVEDEYGFRLEMKPLLYHVITPLEYYPTPGLPTPDIPSLVQVQVLNWYGIGVPGANVTGMLVLIKARPSPNGGLEDISYTVFVESNITSALGECTLDFTDEIADYFSGGNVGGRHWIYHFIILHTNWKGFVAIAGYSEPPERGVPVTGYVIGDYIFLNRSVDVPGASTGAILTKDEIIQAIPEYQSLLTVTKIEWLSNNTPPPWPGLIRPWEEYRVGKIEYLERLSSHIFVLAKWKGSPIVVTISRIPVIDIVYGSREATPANSVTITRIAQIYNYPYIIKLTVWRKVEG